MQHLLIDLQLVGQMCLVFCQYPLFFCQTFAMRKQYGITFAQRAIARMPQLRVFANLRQWHICRFQAQQKSHPRRIGIAVNPLPPALRAGRNKPSFS